MSSKSIHFFILTAGTGLISFGMALLICQTGQEGFVQPRDPLLGIPMPDVFLIFGSISIIAGLVCLFAGTVQLKSSLLLWLAINFLVYLGGLFSIGNHHSFWGYWSNLGEFFDLSMGIVYWLFALLTLFLLSGSATILFHGWLDKSNLKMSCAHCGSHIAFSPGMLGRMVNCPRCQKALTLRRPDANLKMSCFFCQEHIEFPAHAIGEKMPCPHCNMGITLKEPA